MNKSFRKRKDRKSDLKNERFVKRNQYKKDIFLTN